MDEYEPILYKIRFTTQLYFMIHEMNRYVVIGHQNKIQIYGLFNTISEAENWWMSHKKPFLDNDPPFDDFAFVATYDRLENRIVEYNSLYLDLALAETFVEEMLKDNPTKNSRLGIRSKKYAL